MSSSVVESINANILIISEPKLLKMGSCSNCIVLGFEATAVYKTTIKTSEYIETNKIHFMSWIDKKIVHQKGNVYRVNIKTKKVFKDGETEARLFFNIEQSVKVDKIDLSLFDSIYNELSISKEFQSKTGETVKDITYIGSNTTHNMFTYQIPSFDDESTTISEILFSLKEEVAKNNTEIPIKKKLDESLLSQNQFLKNLGNVQYEFLASYANKIKFCFFSKEEHSNQKVFAFFIDNPKDLIKYIGTSLNRGPAKDICKYQENIKQVELESKNNILRLGKETDFTYIKREDYNFHGCLIRATAEMKQKFEADVNGFLVDWIQCKKIDDKKKNKDLLDGMELEKTKNYRYSDIIVFAIKN